MNSKSSHPSQPLADLKASGRVTVIEQRHFIRHPLSLPLVYEVLPARKDKGTSAAKTRTINVSVGGLLFPAKHPVKTGSMIAVKLPFEDKLFKIKSRVVRCVRNPETKFYDIAVKFFRLREAFKVKMIEQIYLISEYRDLLSLQTGKPVSLEEASRLWVERYSERFKRLYW